MDNAPGAWLSEERGRFDRWLLRGTFGLALLLGTVAARAYEVQLALRVGARTTAASLVAYTHLGRQALFATGVFLLLSLAVFAQRSHRGRLYLRQEGAREIIELFPRPREALLRAGAPLLLAALAAATLGYSVCGAPDAGPVPQGLVAVAFAPHRLIGPYPWITAAWLLFGALLGVALRPRGAILAPDGIAAPTVFGSRRFEWGELRRAAGTLVADRAGTTVPVFVSTLRRIEERPEIAKILDTRLAQRDAAWTAAEATLAPLEAVRRAHVAYRNGAALGDERRSLVAVLEAGTAPIPVWRRAIAALAPAEGVPGDHGSFEAIPLLARLARSALDADVRQEAAAALARFAR